MYKLKTSSSIRKRIKCTSKLKLVRHHASRNHLLQKKNSKRKRKLRQVSLIKVFDVLSFKRKLPYI